MPPTYGRARKQIVPDESAGLPQLTEKQELFVMGLLEGLSPRDAYVKAYGKGRAKESTLKTQASKLKAIPEIRQTILYYQRNAQDYSKVSLENHLAELARGRELAYEFGQASAGIQAEHYRGKVAGLYQDNINLRVGPSDEALLSQIAALLGEDMAKAIGSGLGVIEGEAVALEESPESRMLKAPSPLSD